MKVYIPYRLPLNMRKLQAAVTTVESAAAADFSICGKTVPPEVDPKTCVLLQSEPPLTGGRRKLYKTATDYHTSITFRPKGPNEFSFTLGNGNPALYPYSPGLVFDRRRKTTAITNRGVYYAGRKNLAMAKVPDCYTSTNLYGVRHNICNHLLKHYPGAHILGDGWPEVSKAPGKGTPWRAQKQLDIEKYDVDFVLCMENSMLKNYISEKIHDGLSSDRVTLYLGEPEIQAHVPPDCYVCLNHLVNKANKTFNFNELSAIMKSVTQGQYDKILKAARGWRASIVGEHERMRDDLTDFVISRIK